MNLTKTAEQLFRDTLEVSHPARLIREKVTMEGQGLLIDGKRISSPSPKAVYVIAFGKASLPMAESLMAITGTSKEQVYVITSKEDEASYAHTAAHPVPDENSLRATKGLISFVEAMPTESLILAAISGGSSAMVCHPAEGVSLDDIRTVYSQLLKSGAAIDEINAVRKHLSAIKGGGLLRHFATDCTLVDIVISDVPTNDLAIIGSGPTTPDPSTFQDVCDTLLRYDLWEQMPAAVRQHVECGLAGEIPETVKPGEDPLRKHQAYIIGSARLFAETLAQKARGLGFDTWVADEAFDGYVTQVAKKIVQKITKERDSSKSQALVFYGESRLNVIGKGKGGRNQALALHGAQAIDGTKTVSWLSAGTDGIDGPTNAAGAIVDGTTIKQAEAKELDAETYIREDDSYHFHEQMGTLLKTGATGNNVMDVVLILIDTEE